MKLFAKIISMMLVLAMVLSFAACSDDSSNNGGDKDDSKAEESKTQDIGDKIDSAVLTGTWTAEIDYMDEFKADAADNANMSTILGYMTAKYPAKVAFEFKDDGTFTYYIADKAAFEAATNAFVENYWPAFYKFQFEQGFVDETFEEWFAMLEDKEPGQIMLDPDMLDRDGYWFYADGKLYMDDAVSDTYFEVTLEGDSLTLNKGVDTFTYIEDAHLPVTFTKSK